MKKRLMILIIFLLAILLAGCVDYEGTSSGDEISRETSSYLESIQEESSREMDEEAGSRTDETASVKTDLTYNMAFDFDGLQITFGQDIKWTKIENEYAATNGLDVAKVPVTLENKSGQNRLLDMFDYTIYGSKQTELPLINAYFEDDVADAGELKPQTKKESFIHLLYDGAGDYLIRFDNGIEKAEVTLPIKITEKDS